MIIGNCVTFLGTRDKTDIDAGMIEGTKTVIQDVSGTVTSIGDYAFYTYNGQYGLAYVAFPNAVSVGARAFYSCRYLSSVYLPSVETIQWEAFYGCDSLATISLPNVTNIHERAFVGCTSIKSIDFPSLIILSSSAFKICSSLKSALLPNVTDIGSMAFDGCVSLVTVSVPNLVNVEDYAFSDCEYLSCVSMPKVSIMGDRVFDRCFRLISLYLLGSVVVSLKSTDTFMQTPIGGYSSVAGQYGSIYVPASLYNSYIGDNVWSLLASRFVSVQEG